MQEGRGSRAEAAGGAELRRAFALQLGDINVGAEGHAGVRLVQQQNAVCTLVCSEFFRGVVYKVPGKFR